MKTKKYFLFLLLIMIFSINTVSADECYYTSNGFFARYDSNRSTYKEVYIDKAGMEMDVDNDGEIAHNMHTGIIFGGCGEINRQQVPHYSGNKNQCPEYLLLDYNKAGIDSLCVYAFSTASEAQKWASMVNSFSKHVGYYAPYRPGMTKEQYEQQLLADLGNIDDPLNTGGSELEKEENDCAIFGDKNTEGTVAYFVNEAMSYIRIIVPTLIILFGTIDFLKAIVAKNAEDMKKHTMTFVKRVIAGIIVFLAPIIVNAVIDLGNMIWSDVTQCKM